MATMPTCSPLGPTSRTSGTRIRSLMRGSTLMRPPRRYGSGARGLETTAPAHPSAYDGLTARTRRRVVVRVGVEAPLCSARRLPAGADAPVAGFRLAAGADPRAGA